MILHVHMPKTGGHSLDAALKAAGAGHGLGHVRAVEARREHPEALLVGVVRSPWEWYPSWWLHCTRCTGEVQRRALREWGDGETTWSMVLLGATVERESPGYPRGVLWDLPLAGPGGLWSRAVRWHYQDDEGRWAVDVLLDLARLEEGLRALGVEVTLPRLNDHADRSDYALWYDEDSCGWVQEADGSLAAVLGYDECGPSRLGPVVWLAGRERVVDACNLVGLPLRRHHVSTWSAEQVAAVEEWADSGAGMDAAPECLVTALGRST